MEFTKELMDDALEDLEEGTVPANRVPSTYKSLGQDARELGVYQLVLRHPEEASNWFEQSATYFLEGIDKAREQRQHPTSPEEGYWENEPRNLRDALYAALLSHSETVLSEAVDETREMDASFVTEYPEATPWYYYAKALASTISGDARATHYLDSLKADSEKADSDVVPFFEAVVAVLKGVHSADAELACNGLEKLRKQYREEIGGKPDTAIENIDVEATAFLRLAQRKRLEITLKSQYVPDMYS